VTLPWISAINALVLSLKGKRLTLDTQFHAGSLNSLDVRSFLNYMLERLHRQVFLFWNRGTIRHRKGVREFLLKHWRNQAEFFPFIRLT
jgi:hypothetical protein